MESVGFVLYLDTSAIVKLHVEERYTEVVERAVEEALEVHTSAIADLEVRCTLARLRYEGEFESDGELEQTLEDFTEDWGDYRVQDYDEALARRGGELARAHAPLRAYDALHLASALTAFEGNVYGVQRFVAPDQRFLSFDRGLVRAARGGVDLYFDPFPEQAADKE